MKRIVFLDYVRVFACFLVMVVHASENFYGAEGSTDMVGPQSYLANEADRLWVAVYDGFSRMAVPLFIIVSAFLLAPMKAGLTSWQFYRQRCIRILPPFFIFMILYSTLPLLWGQIDAETSLKDISRIFLNFPSQAGHLWFMYPLISLSQKLNSIQKNQIILCIPHLQFHPLTMFRKNQIISHSIICK